MRTHRVVERRDGDIGVERIPNPELRRHGELVVLVGVRGAGECCLNKLFLHAMDHHLRRVLLQSKRSTRLASLIRQHVPHAEVLS